MSDLRTEPDAELRPAEHESFWTRLSSSDFHFDFVGKRRIWYAISAIAVVASILSLVFFRGLNLGIEFRGGSVFTVNVATTSEQTTNDFTSAVDATGLPDLGGTTTTIVGSQTVRVQTRSLTTDEVVTVRTAIAEQAQVAPDEVAYQLIGPSWGKEITNKGIQALVIFLVLVALLIGLYFRNWKMSLSALVALAHDLIVTLGVYSLVGFTFTPASLIGVLTILGYSLYDTVVVFDKVRENSADITKRNYTYGTAANLAVNQMLVRSVNTTIIGVLPVIAILIAGVAVLGGQGALADLGMVMLVGMVAGAYSSIFLATPMLVGLKEREPAMRKHRAALEKRANRPASKIETSIAEVATPRTVMDVDVSAAPIQRTTPTQLSSPAAGRPQPRRSSRSERKK